MKKFSLGLLVGALVVLALSSSMAQQSRVLVKEHHVDLDDPTVIRSKDPTWRPLSEDIAIRIYRDSRGTRRATLGVRVDDRWEPVAVDGQEALMPPAIPVR